MGDLFKAEAITADVVDAAHQRLAISLADASGRETTISLSAEVSAAIARLTSEFAHHADTGNLTPTKMPTEFAIGTGRFEPVVLIRFENDVPYGLSADHALSLGRALIAQAKEMAAAPPLVRQ